MEVRSAIAPVPAACNQRIDLSTTKNKRVYVNSKMMGTADEIVKIFKLCANNSEYMDQIQSQPSVDFVDNRMINFFEKYKIYTAHALQVGTLNFYKDTINRRAQDDFAAEKLMNHIAKPIVKNLAEEFDRVCAENGLPYFVDQFQYKKDYVVIKF